MHDLVVLDDPEVAITALQPMRAAVLAALRTPGSATSVAARLGVPRQRANYHVRALEAQGLVRAVGERRRRGLTERLVEATATSYVVSPAALGAVAPEPARMDRLSARYVVALAARAVREVADLLEQADRAGQQLATLAIDTDIRFATAAERAAFTDELAGAVTTLAARYHDESAREGRWHRLTVTAYPRPTEPKASPAAGGAEPPQEANDE